MYKQGSKLLSHMLLQENKEMLFSREKKYSWIEFLFGILFCIDCSTVGLAAVIAGLFALSTNCICSILYMCLQACVYHATLHSFLAVHDNDCVQASW